MTSTLISATLLLLCFAGMLWCVFISDLHSVKVARWVFAFSGRFAWLRPPQRNSCSWSRLATLSSTTCSFRPQAADSCFFVVFVKTEPDSKSDFFLYMLSSIIKNDKPKKEVRTQSKQTVPGIYNVYTEAPVIVVVHTDGVANDIAPLLPVKRS